MKYGVKSFFQYSKIHLSQKCGDKSFQMEISLFTLNFVVLTVSKQMDKMGNSGLSLFKNCRAYWKMENIKMQFKTRLTKNNCFFA